jgi:hypothetical protein
MPAALAGRCSNSSALSRKLGAAILFLALSLSQVAGVTDANEVADLEAAKR